MGCDGQRHSSLGTNRETFADSVLDVPERLFLGLALTHAAGNRGTLDNKYSVLVPVDRYGELHSQILDPELTTEESGCTRGAAPGSRLPETSGCGA